MKDPPLPQAGETLLHDVYEVLVTKCMMWALVAALLLVAMLTSWWHFLVPTTPAPGYATAIAIPIVVLAVIQVYRGLKETKRLRLGMEGEQSVGQTLERMRAFGYEVFHDVPGKGFNVDHVLIGPAGLFVIETKAVSKLAQGSPVVKYDGERVLVNGLRPDRDPVVQARAAAAFICDLLANILERRVPLRPVVLYPGWFVEKQPRGIEVWVLNPKALAPFVLHEIIVLTPRDVARLAEVLARHVRSCIE
ncbi:MAG: NERD domain-containing protein [Phycisphaerae bacterium]|nr:NERD domain-containing protein [Phycisphaerae bacterium]NUQ09531.1 NERD domain-containing protein [Phycisphaerae bacterium]